MVDLLNTSTTPTTVTLVESKDVIIPHGATEIVLQDEQHALDTFFRGEASRVQDTLLLAHHLFPQTTNMTCATYVPQCR